MDSTTDNCLVLRLLAQRGRAEGHEKTRIPQETMLEILLWLDRFDLDGKQITSRRLRSLVENNLMPLRTVCEVHLYLHPRGDPLLRIDYMVDEEDEPHELFLDLEFDSDVQTAALYLSSCVVPSFGIRQYDAHMLNACPGRRALIAAPALVRELAFQNCDFVNGEEDTLSQLLGTYTFQRLALIASHIQAWQITDKLLESLRLRGCNEFYEDSYHTSFHEKTGVTEEGVLSYCFALGDNLPMPQRRFLRIESVNITPGFFQKVVQASKNSQLTCHVQLWLYTLRLDVSNLDLGVLPSPSLAAGDSPEFRYDIADHGNGIRLVIHFTSYDDENWDVTVRHGKKEDEESDSAFFGSAPEEHQHEQLAP